MEQAELQEEQEQAHEHREDKLCVVALGDVHDRGVETLCVGEAA
jgi:hypothetical protein